MSHSVHARGHRAQAEHSWPVLVLTCTATHHAWLLRTVDSKLGRPGGNVLQGALLRLSCWTEGLCGCCCCWLRWSCPSGLEVFCIGGGAAAPSPEAQVCRGTNLTGLHELLGQVRPGMPPAQHVPWKYHVALGCFGACMATGAACMPVCTVRVIIGVRCEEQQHSLTAV